MGLTIETKTLLERIHEAHPKEFGKVVQKLLALSFIDMGYEVVEERAVQGVDIDMIDKKTGERCSLEVKTSQGGEIILSPKDIEGLERRCVDHYSTYYAALCLPHCLSEGWIIVPSRGIKQGKYSAMRLASKDDGALSKKANAAFPGVLKKASGPLLACRKGHAMKLLRERYGI